MYNSEKFAKRLTELSEELANGFDTYAYIKSVAKYYWIEKRKFFRPPDVANNLMCTNRELNWLRAYWIIATYDDICYYKGWKEWCLNLLEEEKILLPSNNLIIDEDIKYLIENVAWNKQENIDYLHKAILYKYLNLNDFNIPAIVFYGAGWSWKGTFISLLWTIFGENNVLANLWQRDISGSFDTYKGQKLVVEFAELSTNNTNSDYKILNKLKNIIWANKITVNEKWIQPYQIDNIAWFFISSNSNKPLQLDDKDKWNRRFTIIRSINKLINWKEINKAIKNIEKVQNYLAWLHQEYPEVLKYKRFDALDNQDKRELEDRSQSEANQFWEWLEENYANLKTKITKAEVEDYISKFCFENNQDEKEFLKYFWHNSKYPKKKIRIWEKTYYWVDRK